jgi:hypothetical protein
LKNSSNTIQCVSSICNNTECCDNTVATPTPSNGTSPTPTPTSTGTSPTPTPAEKKCTVPAFANGAVHPNKTCIKGASVAVGTKCVYTVGKDYACHNLTTTCGKDGQFDRVPTCKVEDKVRGTMSLNGVKAADVSETQAKNIILKSTNAAGANISLADIIKVELKDVTRTTTSLHIIFTIRTTSPSASKALKTNIEKPAFNTAVVAEVKTATGKDVTVTLSVVANPGVPIIDPTKTPTPTSFILSKASTVTASFVSTMMAIAFAILV